MPEVGPGPGILLFQEIFGINDNMRGLGRSARRRGLRGPRARHVLAPRARFERKDESGMGDAFGMIQRYDFDTARRHRCDPRPPPRDARVHRQGRRGRASASAARSRSPPPPRAASTEGASTRPSATTARPSTACSAMVGRSTARSCSTTATTTPSSPRSIDEVEAPWPAGPRSSSTATTPATRSATGTRRRCTTRTAPTRPGWTSSSCDHTPDGLLG